MSLTFSGQISFRDFNLDRGLAPSSPIDMAHAAYVYNVDTAGGISMDEFYGLESPLTAYTGCGYGNTVGSTCSDATYNNRTLYADCSIIAFDIGCTVYLNQYPVPLTGYSYVYINGSTYELNTNSGVIIGLSEEQC